MARRRSGRHALIPPGCLPECGAQILDFAGLISSLTIHDGTGASNTSLSRYTAWWLITHGASATIVTFVALRERAKFAC